MIVTRAHHRSHGGFLRAAAAQEGNIHRTATVKTRDGGEPDKRSARDGFSADASRRFEKTHLNSTSFRPAKRRRQRLYLFSISIFSSENKAEDALNS